MHTNIQSPGHLMPSTRPEELNQGMMEDYDEIADKDTLKIIPLSDMQWVAGVDGKIKISTLSL